MNYFLSVLLGVFALNASAQEIPAGVHRTLLAGAEIDVLNYIDSTQGLFRNYPGSRISYVKITGEKNCSADLELWVNGRRLAWAQDRPTGCGYVFDLSQYELHLAQGLWSVSVRVVDRSGGFGHRHDAYGRGRGHSHGGNFGRGGRHTHGQSQSSFYFQSVAIGLDYAQYGGSHGCTVPSCSVVNVPYYPHDSYTRPGYTRDNYTRPSCGVSDCDTTYTHTHPHQHSDSCGNECYPGTVSTYFTVQMTIESSSYQGVFAGQTPRDVYYDCRDKFGKSPLSRKTSADDIWIDGVKYDRRSGYWGINELCAIAALNAQPDRSNQQASPVLVSGTIGDAPFAIRNVPGFSPEESIRQYAGALIDGNVLTIRANGRTYSNEHGGYFGTQRGVELLLSFLPWNSDCSSGSGFGGYSDCSSHSHYDRRTAPH